MTDLHFHYGPEMHCQALVLHDAMNVGSTESVRLWPGACKTSHGDFMRPELSMGGRLFHQRGLRTFMRGGEVLALDPWTGRWAVLSGKTFELFRMLERPLPYGDILSNPWMHPGQTEELIGLLLDRNLLQAADWPMMRGPVMPEPFTYPSFFSIHVTEDCNFRCRYCYADAVSSGKRMTSATARAVIERILESYGRHDITIEFHGGEPLLALDVIRDAIDHAGALFRKMGRPPCTFLMQTNGSLVTEKSIEFLRASGIAAGVSMDGPAAIHNRNRIFPGGNGTHEAVTRGMALLRAENIPGGVLAVIENPEDYIEVCQYILSLGYTGFRLNHMVCQGRGAGSPAARGEAFAAGMLGLADFLYEHFLSTGGRFFDVWPLNIMLFHLLSSHRPFMCMRSPCGAGSHALGFDYLGDVYPCEQLTNFPELRMGSVLDKMPLHEMVMTSPVAGRVKGRRVENIEACRDCAFHNFCGGGCTAEAFAVHRTLLHEDAQCVFYRKAFEGLLWKLHDNPGLAALTGQFRGSLPPDVGLISADRTPEAGLQ